MGAFGGAARSLVSLCLVLCVFMTSLAVSVCLAWAHLTGLEWSCLSVSGVTYSLSQF